MGSGLAVKCGSVNLALPEEPPVGFASDVVRCLERYLSAKGVTVARLEAGPRQREALSLYRKLGYTERGPFGSYKPDPLCVFMQKNLGE